MIIDPLKIEIPTNYVLVKPDEDFDTYQLGGNETGILTPLVFKDEKGNEISAKQQHISISGDVYAVPKGLLFYAYEIWSIQDRTDIPQGHVVRAKEHQKEIDYFREHSVRFDVPVDVKINDKVYFEYSAHREADQKGLWVNTDKGLMMLIKYDNLILAKRDEQIIMLNGYVLIENELVEHETDDEGRTFVQAGSIQVVKLGNIENKTRTTANATVYNCGSAVKCYLDFRTASDTFYRELTSGDKILYDPRYARELEYGLHQLFPVKLKFIQRKDIYGIFG